MWSKISEGKWWRFSGIIIGVLFGCTVQAQTFSEFFQQNKTQRKYLLKQIALLQVYIGYVEKGFSIAQQGWGLAQQIKNGEFGLHSLFFSSLKQVNPQVLQYARVAEVAAQLAGIVKRQSSLYQSALKSGQFTSTELQFFQQSFSNLLASINTTLDDLLALTTNGKLEMTDAARAEQIDKVYAEAIRQRTAFTSMEADIRSQALQRYTENGDIEGLRRWYAIP